MIRVDLPGRGFVPVWREAARRLASHGIAPGAVLFAQDAAGDLFEGEPLPGADGPQPLRVPADFITLFETVLCHRDPKAPALLYAALMRHQSDPTSLGNPADPLTRRLDQLAKSVRRDIHKMHAFVRFREIPADGPRRSFGAWFQPEHRILEAATPFFARRFADMDWLIATPQGIVRHRNGALCFHPPGPQPDLPEDSSETLWATYFRNIFNPARLHLKAMQAGMPKKYWKNLPETRLIPEMLQGAEPRVAAMQAAQPATAPARAARILDRQAGAVATVPGNLDAACAAARACRRCGLCEAATQTVWGEGDAHAALMIVGEQPGDHEDLAGRPFVGPAGQVLRGLMAEAGTGPVWLTNAVKHFKFRPRGKQRLHQSPNQGEIEQCRWWLDFERRFVAPRLTVALGASAALALTGSDAPLCDRRGRIEPARDGGPVLITWHPSYLLRLQSNAGQARAELRADLRKAVAMTGGAVVGGQDNGPAPWSHDICDMSDKRTEATAPKT